jgi:hypothetical protein
MRTLHQPVEPAGAIEQRILGVEVKVDKVRVRHGGTLAPGAARAQEGDVHNPGNPRRVFPRAEALCQQRCCATGIPRLAIELP